MKSCSSEKGADTAIEFFEDWPTDEPRNAIEATDEPVSAERSAWPESVIAMPSPGGEASRASRSENEAPSIGASIDERSPATDPSSRRAPSEPLESSTGESSELAEPSSGAPS